MKMLAMAGLVFAADVLAVLLIALSLGIENWLGLPRDVVLDFIFIAAVCFGLAGWIVGKLMMLEFPRPASDEGSHHATESPAHLHAPK